MSSNMGYIRPNLTKMTSQFSWLLIGGEHLRKSSEIFGKIFGKRAASDWLLKIFRRDIDFPKMQKIDKKLIRLTSWATSDPIFRRWSWLLIGGEHLRKSVGNRRKIFGKGRKNLRKSVGKARRKKSREGWVGKARKKQGGVGGGWPERKREGWVDDDVIKKNKIEK